MPIFPLFWDVDSKACKPPVHDGLVMLQKQREEDRRVGKLIDLDAIDDEDTQQARLAIKQEVVEEVAQEKKKAADKIAVEAEKAKDAIVRLFCSLHTLLLICQL